MHFWTYGIYGNFSQPGRKPERQPGQKLFSQGIWPGAPWCSAATDRQKFTNFLRMDVDDFEELFRLVEPAIKKKTAKFR